MTIFFLVTFAIYFLAELALLYGFEMSLSKSFLKRAVCKPVSIIIPIRNEEENISTLIKSLQGQSYPTDLVDLIFVDDHSSDKSAEVIYNNCTINHRIIHLEQKQNGKKAAIAKGVEVSCHAIIITTDADCSFQSNWIKSMVGCFDDEKMNLVAGPVSIAELASMFSKMQSIEFASLIGSGASLLHFGIPSMANGANLAFRKSVFQAVSGYDGNTHIASGDDEFLLRKIFEYSPIGVMFNPEHDSVVSTKPQSNLKQFLHQRIRWASKWKHNSNIKSKIVAVFVFLFQLVFIGLIGSAMVAESPMLRLLVLVKVGIDSIFLFRVCHFLDVRMRLVPFFLLELFYPFYVIFIALLSQVSSFKWKGRQFRT